MVWHEFYKATLITTWWHYLLLPMLNRECRKMNWVDINSKGVILLLTRFKKYNLQSCSDSNCFEQFKNFPARKFLNISHSKIEMTFSTSKGGKFKFHSQTWGSNALYFLKLSYLFSTILTLFFFNIQHSTATIVFPEYPLPQLQNM